MACILAVSLTVSFSVRPSRDLLPLHYSLDEQGAFGAHFEHSKIPGATRIEASEAAEREWVQTIIDKARLTADFQEKCTPGYYNNEGNEHQAAE